METNSYFQKIFKYLKDFKDFPTYQFERRIDAFLLPYLEAVFNKQFKMDFDKQDKPDYVFVFPEFPLKTREKEDINYKRSDQADYMLFSEKLNTILLVELKTDKSSIYENQFLSYLKNSKNGWENLYGYYLHKTYKNVDWRKYVKGLLYMKKVAPKLIENNYDNKINEYIGKDNGAGVNAVIDKIKNNIRFSNPPKICFCYIGPSNGRLLVDGFVTEFDNEKKYYKGYITLSVFADSTTGKLKDLLKEIDPKKQSENNSVK